MIKKKKIHKYSNLEFNLFFLEKEFKKSKLSSTYYLVLFLTTYLKKINELLKYKSVIKIFLDFFFHYKLKFSISWKKRRKRRFLRSLKTKQINLLPQLFSFLCKKKIITNINSYLFLKLFFFFKIKFFFTALNSDINKNFFLFKFFILLNINNLCSFIRIKRFKVFLLLLHFLFNIRKKGWRWKSHYYDSIKFIKKKKYRKTWKLIISNIEKKIMYFLYFKFKIKNKKIQFLNVSFFILHLFLKVNYNLDFFKLKKIYYEVNEKWSIYSVRDLIYLIERRIDIFLNRFMYSIDLNTTIKNISVNNHNNINFEYIINIGDFILFNNLFSNKWYYLLLFFKHINQKPLLIFLKNKFLNLFFNTLFKINLSLVDNMFIIYNFNLYFWSNINNFLLKCINLFFLFFYNNSSNIFFFEFIIDSHNDYFYCIESYLILSNFFKVKFFIFIGLFYVLRFKLKYFTRSVTYNYILKYTFYRYQFFLELNLSFFLFYFLNNIYFNYSKLRLVVLNFGYNLLNSYNIFNYGYSNLFNRYNLKINEIQKIDLYSVQFDEFFYSFINYENCETKLDSNFVSFQNLFKNTKFFFFFSIGSIYSYKIGLSLTKLIYFYLIDVFKLNIYGNWIINKKNIYLIYNSKKELYSLKFNSFFIKKKIVSFLDINIENFF